MLSIIIAAATTATTALAGQGQPTVRHHHHAYAGPIIQTPIWVRAPSFADVAAAYPHRAGGVDGSATMFCRFGESGVLSGCEVTRESPGGLGFGEAAKSLAAKFTVDVDPAWAVGKDQFAVEIPVWLPNPDGRSIRDRLVNNPLWLTKFTQSAASMYFPPEAAARGLTTGRGVAECKVQADGVLHDCQGVSAEPEAVGFSEAAAKAASSMRMNPWTKDGGPVDGATVRVPIRLTLSDTPQVASDHLVWLQTPTGDDVYRAYPLPAMTRNVSGHADMRCRVLSSGAIAHCDVIDESPSGWNFGSAALKLASKYRVSMQSTGHPEPGNLISISAPFEMTSH